MLPKHCDLGEILSAFISQHYLGNQIRMDLVPKEIVIGIHFSDKESMSSTLSMQAKHKVKIILGKRGEQKKLLKLAESSARQSLIAHLSHKINMDDRFLELEKLLCMDHSIKRIECFDISHTRGEATVASCVVFNREGVLKSNYRRFLISDITPGDDVAAIHQVLLRRFRRIQKEQTQFPDLVLIDGGAAQLQAAVNALKELHCREVFLMGVAKGEKRKPGLETIYIPHRAPLHLKPDALVLHFIQQIRDEAHRFAITGHRGRRDKIRRTSVLESIPGIGVKRRQALLRYFGGIQGVNRASLENLSKVPGISLFLAQRLYCGLHDVDL